MNERQLSGRTLNSKRPAIPIWGWVALALGLAAAFVADGPVMAALRPVYGSPLAEAIKHTVRWLGIGYTQALVLLLLVALGAWRGPRLKAAGGWGLLAFAISGAATTVLKVLVHRPRPYVTEARPATWIAYARAHSFQSFPSGESATTFAVALTLGALFPRLRIPLLAIAVVVAAARVVAGDHAPSDVWAGAMLGMATAQWVSQRAEARRGAAAAVQRDPV